MEQEKRGIAINLSAGNTHYTDHLAVVCVVMDIPLLVTDKAVLKLIEGLYPRLNILFKDMSEVNPDYLACHYDVLFQSGLYDRTDFYALFHPLEEKYHKVIRNVHCPHGFSDKKFYLESCAREDIALVYGENMLDLLKQAGVFETFHNYVITGNYRYQYYKAHREHLDSVASKVVFSQFQKQQPIILYAPTWNDAMASSSFFEAAEELLDRAPDRYNILVKLHPYLEEDDIVSYYRILGKYEKKGNIVFVKDFPVIYPLLAKADVYIGDMSSIGYDFLAFNRPMFFLNHRRSDSFLYKCGIEITPDQYQDIYRIIEQHLDRDAELFSDIRKSVYDYTFGQEIPFDTIKKDIIKAYNRKRVLV